MSWVCSILKFSESCLATRSLIRLNSAALVLISVLNAARGPARVSSASCNSGVVADPVRLSISIAMRAKCVPLRSNASMVFANVGAAVWPVIASISLRCASIAMAKAGLKCSGFTCAKGGNWPGSSHDFNNGLVI